MSDVRSLISRDAERGNTAIIVLVALIIVAVGAVAFLSDKIEMPSSKGATETAAAEPAAGEQQQETAQAPAAAAQQEPFEIKPGNPVVAKVGGEDLTRVDVFNFIQGLAPQTRQNIPPAQLFPLALNQVVNARLIEEKAANVNLDNDPVVKAQVEAAKKQIVQQVFIQKEIEKGMTEERLKATYDQYVANFPEIPERKTAHILVKEEAEAKDVLKQLKAGGDFAAIAQERSIDPTKDNGGVLGYISKQDQIIPEYLEAAFALNPGETSTKPVKTETGYYIIRVDEERIRPPAPYDENTKAFLKTQLTNQVLNETIQKWRSEADVTVFDINGDAIEPSAGNETSEQPAQ